MFSCVWGISLFAHVLGELGFNSNKQVYEQKEHFTRLYDIRIHQGVYIPDWVVATRSHSDMGCKVQYTDAIRFLQNKE